jgi:hypothetical protein
MKQRALAVGLDFALRGAAGLILASPVVAAIASTGIPRFPEGDRLLFEPGGLMLVEVARALWSAAIPLVRTELVTGLLLGIALLVPYSLLLVALKRRASTPLELWGEAVTRVPSLLALHGLALLTQGGAILATTTFALGLRPSLVGATSRGADLMVVGVLLFGGLLVLGLAVLRDLASAACVEESLGSRVALGRAHRQSRRVPRGRVAGGRRLARAPGGALRALRVSGLVARPGSRPRPLKVSLRRARRRAGRAGRSDVRADPS